MSNSSSLILATILLLQLYAIRVDARGDNWVTQVSGPNSLKFTTLSYVNNTIYSFGGSRGGVYINNVYKYDTTTNGWLGEQITSGMIPTGRYAHGAGLSTNKSLLLIFGGGLTSGRLNDMNILDLTTYTWLSLNSAANSNGTVPAVRSLPTMVVNKDDVAIIFGGSNGPTGTFYNDIWRYDIASDSYTPSYPTGTAPAVRSGHCAHLLPNNTMIVFGGWQGTVPNPRVFFNDINMYDIAADAWLTVLAPTSPLPPPRYAFSSVLTSTNRLVIWGGGTTGSTYLGDVWAYDVAKNEWEASYPTGVAPDKSEGSTATILPGDLMYIFGGQVGTAHVSYMRILALNDTNPPVVPTTTTTGAMTTATTTTGPKPTTTTTGPKPTTTGATTTVTATPTTTTDNGLDNIGGEDSDNSTKKGSGLSTTIIAIIAVFGGFGFLVLVLVAVMVTIALRKPKNGSDSAASLELSVSGSTSKTGSHGNLGSHGILLDGSGSDGHSNYAPIFPATSGSGGNMKVKTWDILWDELELQEELGKGAFGVVYKARWRNQDVAVKKLIGEFSSQEIETFLGEADLMGSLRPHENVIQFFGVCTSPVAIVSRFYAAGSLEHYLKSQSLSLKDMIHILKGIVAGVHHLHRENIVHRDLASRNILLGKGQGGKFQAVVSDFGFAREVESQSSSGMTTANIGPVRWMSPESLLNRTYSPKSDTFSFGVIVWEVITRKRPWEEIDDVNVIIAVTGGKRLPIPECPPELAEMMKKCFETDPSIRPSFQQLFDKLEDIENKY